MPESWFRGLFDTALTTAIAPVDFLLCVGVSLALGLLLCAMTLWRSPFSCSLAVTLAILPAVVCVVIMMVNGNVGTGVAVAGAFNLVRFRSAPGSDREIGAIFVAMGTGLITGMGYLGYGCLFTLILGDGHDALQHPEPGPAPRRGAGPHPSHHHPRGPGLRRGI